MVEGDLYPVLHLLCGLEQRLAGETVMGNMKVVNRSRGVQHVTRQQLGLAGVWSQLSLGSCFSLGTEATEDCGRILVQGK